jgi:hypothetical protein
MSAPAKFAYDDIVKAIKTGGTGTVKRSHHDENGYIYGVQLARDPATEIDVPASELELVKVANDDETGFAIRYIS